MPDEADTATPLKRSVLFSLPLEGKAPHEQEGVFEYAMRLSVEHHLHVRDLLAHVILPAARLDGAFFAPGHFSAHALRGCNGWSSYAVAFLAAMQELTGRADLWNGSMVRWGALLDPRGYAAKTRRWCPECLRLQRARGYHTFSLLWAFDPVRVCPAHELMLCERCGRCGAAQPIVGDSVPLGRCANCAAPLSESRADAAKLPSAAADLFRASAVAGMIEARERASLLAVGTQFRLQIVQAARACAQGSIHRLEKQLNFSYMSLGGARKFTLAYFLELMYRLGVAPVPFLAGESSAQPDPRRAASPWRAQRRLAAAELAELGVRVAESLERAKANASRMTTRREFTQGIGLSNSAFQTHFPDAKRELRAHNDSIREAVHVALWTARTEAIERAMRRLVDHRGPYTASAIATSLRQEGLHRRHPRVRQLAMDALRKALAEPR